MSRDLPLFGHIRDDPAVGSLRSDPDNFAELVEIERASAKLHGRDPARAEETVRARLREIADKAEREKRNEAERRELEALARRRPFVIGAGIVGGVILLGSIGWGIAWGVARMKRAEAFTATFGEAGKGLTALGFSATEDWVDAEGETIVMAIPEKTCAAVIAVAEGSPALVDSELLRPSGTSRGPGPHLWCSCAAEEAKVTLPAGPEHVAVRLLTGDFASVGGAFALANEVPEEWKVTIGSGDGACAHEAAAIWVKEDDRAMPVPFPDHVAKNPRFVAAGMEPAGLFPPDRPFVALPSAAATCYFAQPFGEGGKVQLRGEDGAPISEPTNQAFGWCHYGEATKLTLWREQGAEVPYVVTRASAKRVGGSLGLGELAARQGHDGATLLVLGGDLTKDAKAALVASSVGAATVVLGGPNGLPGGPDRRVVAATMRREGTLAPAGDIPRSCRPEPSPAAALSHLLCVQADAQPWRGSGEPGSWGAAEAELPVWLWELAKHPSPPLLDAMVSILVLARRLHQAGFEPTSVDGVEPTVWGAEISRRGKTTEVVAVAMTDKTPWFHPLTDGEPWGIGDAPQVVRMPEEGKLTLRAPKPLSYDPKAVSVVVWRR